MNLSRALSSPQEQVSTPVGSWWIVTCESDWFDVRATVISIAIQSVGLMEFFG
jgi:hypothetical protein